MLLTKKQEEVILNKSRFKVLNWGRRSGKTTVFAYEALGTALTIPNAHITYYAQTFADARDIAWNIFLEVFGECVESKNETLLEIKVNNLKGGLSLVSLKGWESVYQSGKGRGTENDLVLHDEVAFCRNFIENYEKVIAPTLLTTKGRAIFGSTPRGFNDFHTLVNKAQSNEGWFYSHATSYDNPHNDPAEIGRIKNEISDDRFQQEYMADFRKTEGLVYKEFDRVRHLFDKLPERVCEVLVGVDFGFTNPCGVLVIKKDYDDNYWVTNEWYERRRTSEQIAEYVYSLNGNKVYPDPESPEAIQVLRNKGINVCDVVKGKDSVVNGINRVRELFKQGRLHIHKNCINLIFELETYAYPDKTANHNEPETPIKESDHLLDALRYVLTMNIGSSKSAQEQLNQFLQNAYNNKNNSTR
jgi:hypothetical protein